jgi:hypothetical protein
MANILGCFNCEFFQPSGARPKSHVPGHLYRGSCGSSVRPNAAGEMSIRMTQERPASGKYCEYHSAAQHVNAADGGEGSPDFQEYDMDDDRPLCTTCGEHPAYANNTCVDCIENGAL